MHTDLRLIAQEKKRISKITFSLQSMYPEVL